MTKILIVGGVAGGMSAATRLRRLMEDAEIIVFDKGPYVSFANCGLPFHVSGEIAERDNLSLEDYRNGQDTAIMHFYEKLLKLKDLMNTTQVRKMAEHRHIVLEAFLTEFYAEWDGKC